MNTKTQSKTNLIIGNRYFSNKKHLCIRAILDFIGGIKYWFVWTTLAWQEIKQRYRRSILGPFWFTLSTGIFILAIGPIYSQLMGQNVETYMYWMANSLIIWMLFSNIVSDACQVFISAEAYIKQTNLPFTVYIFQMLYRNFIIFCHHFLILIVLQLYFQPVLGWSILSILFALINIAFAGAALGFILGLISVRFRDVPPIVGSLMQILMFVTPVMWKPSMIATHRWVVEYNPLYHFMELIRAPLIEMRIPLHSWFISVSVSIFLCALAFGVFSQYRHKIAYWV